MVLLHCCTLVPEGEGANISAVRFAAPIRVDFLRIYPTGTRPFPAHSPNLIACTEPSAFSLDILFNALPRTPEAKEKQRAANALVPTSLAYAGGLVDFSVDMGMEYATRLMIVKGAFESLTLALYGEIASTDMSDDLVPYDPQPLPDLVPLPLSSRVDPANMVDPCTVANQLLSMISECPLPLVARLMFCLKPSDEDWDSLEFPHLYADLDLDMVDDLDAVLDRMARPIRDGLPMDTFNAFAIQVSGMIGPKVELLSANQAFSIAKLLSIAAPQDSGLVRALLKHLELESIFDMETMNDHSTLQRLWDAVANIEITRHLNVDWFLEALDHIQQNGNTKRYTRALAGKIQLRMQRWIAFEDVLLNQTGDLREAAKLLSDVSEGEQSMAIWLQNMLEHPSVAHALSQTPPNGSPRLSAEIGSREDLVMWTRAYMGVGSVLAVWAWADSLGKDAAAEQTLATIKLWQDVDGYSQIVNQLLLLRQFPGRLEWEISDREPPRQSGILAEQIFARLMDEPGAILHDSLVDTVLKLEQPMSHISKEELMTMRHLALLVDGGLQAAIRELVAKPSFPWPIARLRVIRLALVIVKQELEDGDDGEWRVLEALWAEDAHGLVGRMVELYLDVTANLSSHFTLAAAPMDQALVSQLLYTAADLVRLIIANLPAMTIPAREMRMLVSGIAAVFACAETAAKTLSQCVKAAADVRQACLEAIDKLTIDGIEAEPHRNGSEVVLRELLGHAHAVFDSGRDPTTEMRQLFVLIDRALPNSNWTMVLVELEAYFPLLDAAHKSKLFARLVELDGGELAIGEWLLTGELKQLLVSLESDGRDRVRLHWIYTCLDFLATIAHGMSEWMAAAVSSDDELSKLLALCLTQMLDAHLVSPVLNRLIRSLTARAAQFQDPELKFAIVLCSLRAFQHEPAVLLSVLRELPSDQHQRQLMRREIGLTLLAISRGDPSPKAAQTTLDVLTWLTEQDDPSLRFLSSISASALVQLYVKLAQKLGPSPRLNAIKSKVQGDEDEAMVAQPVELPSQLSLSLREIEERLRPVPGTPNRTTPTPDILGITSSPTGLLRSPAATGLTKTYANNDFRQLRQAAGSFPRLNTSRLPSMHVDVGTPRGPT
ncbi:unnamed protein product [Mycena citricolor]|uniref:Virilizer N-terminal domain-containing protein n=1 Tax=Mycena citricolor TaxID=2018698 RepID=A0AAD2GSR3_9AGAR|nr:unnamed protein product [Mycena citricolor]